MDEVSSTSEGELTDNVNKTLVAFQASNTKKTKKKKTKKVISKKGRRRIDFDIDKALDRLILAKTAIFTKLKQKQMQKHLASNQILHNSKHNFPKRVFFTRGEMDEHMSVSYELSARYSKLLMLEEFDDYIDSDY